MRLCQEEIGLGSRWGSKSPRGVELQPGQGFADGSDVAAIDDLIASVRGVSDAEKHLKAEVDDTDDTEAEEAALLASADKVDDPDAEEPRIAAKVLAAPVAPVAPKAPAVPAAPLAFAEDDDDPLELPGEAPTLPVPGELLREQFGFVPHCEVCGEVQFQSPGGMTCPRGHGGAASVPPAGDALEEVAATDPASVILPGTADAGDISNFLLDPSDTAPVVPRQSRFQVEEEDSLGLDSILAAFDKV